MIREPMITNLADIVYLSDGTGNDIPVNPLSPTFPWTRTGVDATAQPGVQPGLSQGLISYKLLSPTTGAELKDSPVWLLGLSILTLASDSAITDYHAKLEVKNSLSIKSSLSHLNQVQSPDRNSASIQAWRLREISGLKIEHLAKIFGVSRTTYYKWIEGSSIHNGHRECLFEALALVEDANQCLGSVGATNAWLLTPVSPGGKKPLDYLAEREYAIFRGFLLRIRTGHEVFQPVPCSKRVYRERSQEEFEDALERLRPPIWRDEESDSGE
jgi:hypothetical protein